MRYAIWYYLYHLKNVKNTLGGVVKYYILSQVFVIDFIFWLYKI